MLSGQNDQLCLGQNCGIGHAIHSLRAPDRHKNAFNRLNRPLAEKVYPSLLSTIGNPYKAPSPLFVDGKTPLSKKGTTLGDPLAMRCRRRSCVMWHNCPWINWSNKTNPLINGTPMIARPSEQLKHSKAYMRRSNNMAQLLDITWQMVTSSFKQIFKNSYDERNRCTWKIACDCTLNNCRNRTNAEQNLPGWRPMCFLEH